MISRPARLRTCPGPNGPFRLAKHPQAEIVAAFEALGIDRQILRQRTYRASSRADTVLGNWARDPHPSEYDAEIDRKIEWIEDVIRSGDVSLIREVCGDILGGLVRLVELRNRARRQSGRRLLHRVNAWQTERLRGRLF